VRGREEVEMVIRERSRMQESCFFRDGIFKFVLRWDKCIINVLVAYAEKESIPFIFNDESTGSCICLRLDLYMSHVKNITDTHHNNTCFSSSPTYLATRAHTCIRNAYQC
jgi:hypothetical protein